ncbi:helix-turn-helix domain-containing protein [Streptomyces sp. ME02-6991-2A]|uniref:helix-turn-helix domain-containing protein n=1 Tax=Streptomyces TaxID=1883 RepID=UPI0010080E75|nr:helix-turn-helix domain-containing protein [Streptomyces sp. ME02-6991-2A]MDX3378788.1 helix-turn-helix domain-containing protein [Streptomyces sp. ME02-6991-2A]
MGRPENPVDQTVAERAELAEYLRECKRAADLTYRQMSEVQGGRLSKATFERAASGSTVPSWETVEQFIAVTLAEKDVFGPEVFLTRGHDLWVRARRATRAPYYVRKAPDPTLLSDTAGFLRALRHQHVWAGCPSPGEMERTAGPGELPQTTTRRIIAGDALPVDPRQALAFLRACLVQDEPELEQWLAAAVRALQDDPDPSRARNLGRWVQAHNDIACQVRGKHLAQVTPLREHQENQAA